jgi:tetratricopeptide (TPR) repeat protein
VEEALKLHQERLSVFEELGDRRSRAVTLGDIARIRVSKGEVEEALKLQNQRLETNKELGDLDGIGAALFDIAQIELQQQSFQEAYNHLSESYAIFNQIGRLDFLCYVGMYLGHLLCQADQKEDGIRILRRSEEGFLKLGWDHQARQVEEIIRQQTER